MPPTPRTTDKSDASDRLLLTRATPLIGRSAGLGRTRIFHPWGREPEGGWSGSDVSVSHVVRSGLRSVTCDASARWVLALVQ